MVVAIRLTKETAEMMRSQKERQKQLEQQQLQQAAQSSSSSESTRRTRNNNSRGRSTPDHKRDVNISTPPRGMMTHDVSLAPKPSLPPTRQQQQQKLNTPPPHQKQHTSTTTTTALQSSPAVSESSTLQPSLEEETETTPTPLLGGTTTTTTNNIPTPSFGMEDYKVLAGCIENMDSLEEEEGMESSGGGTAESNNNIKTMRQQQQCSSHQYYMSSDKVEAASRAAAAVLAGSGSETNSTNKDNTSQREFQRQHTEVHSNLSTTNSTESTATATAGDQQQQQHEAEQLLESTARGILDRNGSNESVVVSSPSVSREEENASSSCLSHSNSPASFLLDDSILDPKSSFSNYMTRAPSFAITPSAAYNNNNNNRSPTSLEWDGMDNFFDGASMTDLGTPSTIMMLNGGSSLNLNNNNKRKSETSFGNDDNDDGNHNLRYSTTESGGNANKRSRNLSLLGLNDSFGQSFAHAPIASFGLGVFGSLSNSSAEMNTTGVHGDHHGNDNNNSSNKQQQPPVKTMTLSPRNRLTSSLHKSPSSSLPPQAPHLSDEEAISLAEAARKRAQQQQQQSQHHCPSKGTFEQYDTELYNKLKNTSLLERSSSTSSSSSLLLQMPQLLVPHDKSGTRLTILRDSSIVNYKLDDCVQSKTYEFYKFLREIYPALEGCTYLLPGLVKPSSRRMLSEDEEDAVQAMVGPTINVSSFGNYRLGHVPGMTRAQQSKLFKKELTIAKRRVECAIYAFGGTVTRKNKKQPITQPTKPDKMSIFRTPPNVSAKSSRGGKVKGGGGSSSKQQQQGGISHSNSIVRREKYEKKLRQQYFEHGNRLSWDVQSNLALTLNGAKTFDDDELKRTGSNASDGTKSSSRKNRCKKCGQIKQGHVCPYVSSLARNIGVMVYPSANAFVADEPGSLAPALCEMNNFITFNVGSGSSFGNATSSPDKKKRKKGGNEDNDDTNDDGSPRKMVAGADDILSSPFRRKALLGSSTVTCKSIVEDKRSDVEDGRASPPSDGSEDLLFQPKMEITTDQYRAVTSKVTSSTSTTKRGYVYPQVPLTFSQRKSMSDALFSLSKLVPKLTDECALVLTEARKRDQWDLAVAELMVQVICVLHCSPSKDYTLEGLRRYLLTLGIVC